MLKILLRIYSSKDVIILKVALVIPVVKMVLTPHRVTMTERIILGTSCLPISGNRFP